MSRRVAARLADIDDALEQITRLVAGRSFDDFASDRIAAAAFERFLEIISEATRHLPEDLKTRHPNVPWRRVADLGNWLRHAYHRVDLQLLWDTQMSDLPALRAALKTMVSGLNGEAR